MDSNSLMEGLRLAWRRTMDRMQGRSVNVRQGTQDDLGPAERATAKPTVAIFETDSEYLLVADVPGATVFLLSRV